MALHDSGAEIITDRLVGDGTPYDNSNAYLGVGDGDNSVDKSDTDLQGSNTFRGSMESDYPEHTEGTNSITFKHIYHSDEANFEWLEWAIFNAESGGEMLNRVQEDNGRKVEGQTWEFTVTVDINA